MDRFNAPHNSGLHFQSSTPEPSNLAEFLENPARFRPRPEYVNASFLVDDDTVLTHCIKLQNVAAVERLLRAGADPNLPSRKGIAPISGAAHKGNTAIMQLLITSGAAVNSMNSTGSTALIQAAHFGHLDAVRLLLHHHAASDFANQKGTTALMRASQEGHVDISKCLIGAGVDVNRKNHEGMNALMLASQRGHAGIVYVLVKAGATMDEQTAQGSTALMLACKRGHEKCAEVLVSMGAEIYMRDRRMRTARDTATRRNHHGLLVWLDTQVQVKRIQEGRYRQRLSLLEELRAAHQCGRLRLSSSLDGVLALFNVVKRIRQRQTPSTTALFTDPRAIAADEEVITSFAQQGRVYSVAATKQPSDTLQQLSQCILMEERCNEMIAAQPQYRNSSRMALRQEGYSDWQWPFLLLRCMSLPSGIFELIMEMLPLPRVWQWSLLRLKRRCKLAPHQAVQDLSIIMDEIIRDSSIFAGGDQTNLLMKINRSPQSHSFLMEKLGMSEAVLDSICAYADTQGMLLRNSEQEVTFKPHYARNMLSATVELYRWYRNRANALKLLLLQPVSAAQLQQSAGASQTRSHVRKHSANGEESLDEGDMETTDMAGEDDLEGHEDGEEEVSDFEGEFVPAEEDQDSENEMQVDGHGGAMQVLEDSDSDGDGPAPPASHANMFAVGL